MLIYLILAIKALVPTMMKKCKMCYWLFKHDACMDGYAWAVKKCNSLEEAWKTAEASDLIWAASMPGIMDIRQRQKFLCVCLLQMLSFIENNAVKDAVRIFERLIDEHSTPDEMVEALHKARKERLGTTDRVAYRLLSSYFDKDPYDVLDIANQTSNRISIVTVNARYFELCGYDGIDNFFPVCAIERKKILAEYAVWIRENVHPDFDNL